MIDAMNSSDKPRLMLWTVHVAVFEVKTADKTSGGSWKGGCASFCTRGRRAGLNLELWCVQSSLKRNDEVSIGSWKSVWWTLNSKRLRRCGVSEQSC